MQSKSGKNWRLLIRKKCLICHSDNYPISILKNLHSWKTSEITWNQNKELTQIMIHKRYHLINHTEVNSEDRQLWLSQRQIPTRKRIIHMHCRVGPLSLMIIKNSNLNTTKDVKHCPLQSWLMLFLAIAVDDIRMLQEELITMVMEERLWLLLII